MSVLQRAFHQARANSQFAEQSDIALPFPDFCERYLLIQNKDGKVVPFVLNKMQRHLYEHLTGRDLVLKARQMGVTTLFMAYKFYRALQGGFRSNTLCHDDELTQELRAMATRMYENLPDHLQPYRKYANARLTTYPTISSRMRIATVGGGKGRYSTAKRKGRGGTYDHLHGTEVATWADAESVISGAMQAGNPDIVLEGTANGAWGYFYELCTRAARGDDIWTLHFYAWWWHEEYQLPLEPGEVIQPTEQEQDVIQKAKKDGFDITPEQLKWRRRKIQELPRDFIQEYPEDPHTCFLVSGDSYFGNILERFTAPMDVTPIDGRRYVAGLDFGQSKDYTVMVILDTVTLNMVFMLRLRKLGWTEMRRQIIQTARHWNNCMVVCEFDALGRVNLEELQKEGGQEVDEEGKVVQPALQFIPFKTSAKSKPLVIQGLHHGVHEGGLSLQPYPDMQHEFQNFISKQSPLSGQWQYQAAEGGHDDTVMATALAWHGIQSGGIRIGFV